MDIYYVALAAILVFASVVIPTYGERKNRRVGGFLCAVSMCGLFAVAGAIYLGAAVADSIVKPSLVAFGDITMWLAAIILFISLLRAERSRETVNGLVLGFVWRTKFVRLP